MPVVCAVAVPHPPIILPQVGCGEEAKIEVTSKAFRAAMEEVARHQPETVVVISPHAPLYADWFHFSPGTGAKGNFASFDAPELEVEARYDTDLVAAMSQEAKKLSLPAGADKEGEEVLDHGTMIPLVFLQQVYSGFKVVRVGLSGLDYHRHYQLGQCIAAAAGTKRVAVIASGDLSHKLKQDGPYGFAPQGPVLDKAITSALSTGDFNALMDIAPRLAGQGAECGLRSFIVMAGALDGCRVEAKLLSYQDTFGVGYAVATFLPGAPDESRQFLEIRMDAAEKDRLARRQKEDAFVTLARNTIESYVIKGKTAAVPQDLPPALVAERAGVFVSLHKGGELRGCIGTISPTTASVAEEIVQNAVSAATKDPRFPPVRPEELDLLEINVDVLGPPEKIKSEEQLDPQRYGVIVSRGIRRGLLLPDLEGVDTVRQQVEIARHKAGIPFSEPVQLERFIVVRHT